MSKREKYANWFPQKMRLDETENVPFFREREVWWCQMGVNVGFEIFGKGRRFTRPVLIAKKHSKYTFLGIPLSTAEPKFEGHVPLRVDNKDAIARLDQLRTLDARRLTQRPIQRVSETDFKRIKALLVAFLAGTQN